MNTFTIALSPKKTPASNEEHISNVSIVVWAETEDRAVTLAHRALRAMDGTGDTQFVVDEIESAQ